MIDRIAVVGTRLGATMVFLFLALPLIVVCGASFSSSPFLEFPPSGFSLRWYSSLLSDRNWTSPFMLSLWLTLVATPIATFLGTLAGYGMVRWAYPGKAALVLFFLSPLMVSEVVLGLSLLYYFSALGLVNSHFGLLMAYVLLGIPYVARTVAASVQTLDRNVEVAAESLGAGPVRRALTIVLPLILPGVLAGACFAAVLAFGELAITIFIGGPSVTTLPLKIYSNVQFAAEPSVAAAATLVILIAILVVTLLERFLGFSRIQSTM